MSEQPSDWVSYLKKAHLFSTLTDEELLAIAKRMVILSLPKGAILFKRGDPGDAFYVIHSGRLQVIDESKPNPAKILAYLGRSESLGEMALLTGEPRTITARADTTSELLVLYKKDFERLLQKKPTIGVHLSRILSSRLASAGHPAAPRNEGEIHVIMGTLGLEDEALLVLNLALSLVEQTRRKIALVEISDEPGKLSTFLGLNMIHTTEAMLSREDLHNPAVLHKLGASHPSGLEVISLPTQLFRGELGESLPILLSTLREAFDHALIRLPVPGSFLSTERSQPESVTIIEIQGEYSSFVQPLLEDADRILLAVDPGTKTPDQLPALIVSAVSEPQKIKRVWISTDAQQAPADFRPDFKIPWRADFSSEFERTRSVYLLQKSPLSQRMVDRLARFVGRLRVGIAMGSGAAYGYSLIGILKVLEREGIYPDVIAGTSMGALVGSFYASGKSPKELEEIALTITKAKLWSLADFTLPRSGVLVGRELIAFLKSVIGDVTFDQLPTPFACVATDIRNGQEVILKEGPVAEAVRASLSLPFFFQPYYQEGRYLVDGGLVNPVPTSVIVNLGADILLSVNLTTKPSEKRIPRIVGWRRQLPADLRGPGLIEILIKTIYTMQHEIAQWRSEVAHVVLEPEVSEFTWTEFHRSVEISKSGEACAEEALPKIKALLPFYAASCKVTPGLVAKKRF